MADRSKNFNSALQEYANKHSLRLNEFQKEIIDYTMKLEWNIMLGAFECVQLFQVLLKSLNAKKVIEVGTFTGYTTLSIAQALGDDAKIVTTDISSEFVRQDVWKKAGVDHKIKFLEGPADVSLNKLLEQGEAGTYDFVFIDADKVNYHIYYEQALKLVRKGGIIAIDNVLWFGKVLDETIQDDSTKAIRKLNEFIRDDQRVDLIMLIIGDGLTLCSKK